MDIKPLPQTPVLSPDVDKTSRMAFGDIHSRINQLIKWLGEVSKTVLPPGAVMAFARSTPPDGWLECNGQAVSRTTYAALFAAIGTTFGAGDGATTFNLPDLRGEFIRGWDHGRGVDGGRAFGSWQADGIKSHNHPYQSQPYLFVESFDGGDVIAERTSTAKWVTHYTSNFGGPETRPRNIALLYCIKY